MSRYPGPALTTGLQNYAEKANTSVVSPASGKTLALHSMSVRNRSAGNLNLGALVKFGVSTSSWKLQVLTTGGTVATDNTADIQAGTEVQVVTTTDDDGFLIQAHKPFNLIGMNVSTADGGSSTYAVSFWNGTAFATVGDLIEATSLSSTGNSLVMFSKPNAWVAGSTAGLGEQGLFTIRVAATTAGPAAVDIDELYVAELLDFRDTVADNASLDLSFDDPFEFRLTAGESLLPYFSTANALNQVVINYDIRD